MKLVKWLLIAVLSCVLCVVTVSLVRRAVTPSQPAARLAPSSQQAPSRVPIETVAHTNQPAAESVQPRPTSAPVVATPIGNLPAPSLVTQSAPKGQPNTVSPTPTSSVTPKPTPQMAHDPSVERAQKLLAELGYAVGKPDGKLGPRTEAALEAFQKDHALAVTKKADAATLARLEEESKRRAVASLTTASPTPAGSTAAGLKPSATPAAPRPTGEPQILLVKGSSRENELQNVPDLTVRKDVARVQKALAAAGFYDSDVDGKWGKASLEALQKFQKSVGLSPSGKVDAETWKKLVLQAGPTPTPLPDILVVVPVSKTLKKSKLTSNVAWYTPAPAKALPATSSSPSTQASAGQDSSAQKQAKTVATNEQKTISTNPQKPAGTPTPVVRPAATPPAGVEAGEVAKKAGPDAAATPAPQAPAPSAAPSGSALTVAAAPSTDKTPPSSANTTPAHARAQESLATLPLPHTPAVASASNGTYAQSALMQENPDTRIQTVAREKSPSHLLTGRGDQTSETQSLAPVQDPSQLAEKLRAAARDLERTSTAKPKRDQALEKVQAVESVYSELKARWAGKFSDGAVADQIHSVESGYKAMKADFQKGEYDRIISRGDGFKRAIEIVEAHAYVASMLSKPDVRAKLPKSELQAIETLRKEAERNPERLDKQEKFLEAKALIQSRVATKKAASQSQRAESRAN